MLAGLLAFFMIPWVFVAVCVILVVAGSYHVSRDYSFWATAEFAILLFLGYMFFQPNLSLSDLVPFVLAYVGIGTLWSVWRWIVHVRKYKSIVHESLKISYKNSGARTPLTDDLNVVNSLGSQYAQRSLFPKILRDFRDIVHNNPKVDRGTVYQAFAGQIRVFYKHQELTGPDDDRDLLEEQREFFQSVLPRISSIRGFMCEWIWLWPLSMLGHLISDTVTVIIDSLTGMFSRISGKIMGLPTV